MAGQPLVLQLDVDMEAPVITMPRSSNSGDAIKLDLGSLHLANTVAWVASATSQDKNVSTLLARAGLTYA